MNKVLVGFFYLFSVLLFPYGFSNGDRAFSRYSSSYTVISSTTGFPFLTNKEYQLRVSFVCYLFSLSETLYLFGNLFGKISTWVERNYFFRTFNPFLPNAPFLYPLKTRENRKIFWCFPGVEKGCIRNKWVKNASVNKSTLFLLIYWLCQSNRRFWWFISFVGCFLH